MAEEEKKLTINKEEQNEAEDIQPVLDDEMKEIPGGGGTRMADLSAKKAHLRQRSKECLSKDEDIKPMLDDEMESAAGGFVPGKDLFPPKRKQ